MPRLAQYDGLTFEAGHLNIFDHATIQVVIDQMGNEVKFDLPA